MARKTQYRINKLKQNKSGGSAAAGGMNFQACVTAIAAIHVARGTPLGWLNGIAEDIPVSLAAETGGPGDDICLELKDSTIAEIQVKKGLSAGKNLWDSLLSLASAIDSGLISYGVLIVSPDSSANIRNDLARDIIRMGCGRDDDLKPLSQQLKSRLVDRFFDIEKITAKLRIVTVNALETDSASINAARAELGHLCENVQSAWDHLYRDSHSLIEFRGRRTVVSVWQLLRSAGIALRQDKADSPLVVLQKLSSWVVEANDTFPIFGIGKPLPLDTAWIEMKALVQEEVISEINDVEEALKRYHSWDVRSVPRDAKQIDSITLGQFVRHAVVMAGPGMGKTTLLKRLSRSYAKSGYPALQVRLRDVATRMRSLGLGFEESVLELGLDGSGLKAEDLRRMNLGNIVLLCDGLDECGRFQIEVTQGLLRFTAGHPQYRIIVTTRPIGYDSSLLKEWRHYELVPLDSSSAKRHLSKLLASVLGEKTSEFNRTLSFAEEQLNLSHVKAVATRSPMLLGFLVALSLRNKSAGTTRAQLYQRLFELIEELPTQRHEDRSVSSAVMLRFLEILGWNLLLNPYETRRRTLELCANDMRVELDLSMLKAKDVCQQCADRWQDLGMIEQVRFQADEVLTFIHKTFSEYAAAKYLAQLDPQTQTKSISDYAENASWIETIKFACSMGMGFAEKVIDALLDSIPDGQLNGKTIQKACEFLNECNEQIDCAVIEKLIDHAWGCVISPHRWAALQAGFSLTSISSRFPEEVCRRATGALFHEQPWTRLSAWACVTAAGPQYYDYQAMLDMLKALPNADYRFKRLHTGGLWINDPRSKIIEAFVLSATKAILAHNADTIGLAVLGEILEDIGQTVAFNIEMSALLMPYGIGLRKGYSLEWEMPQLASGWQKNLQAQYTILLDVLDDSTVDINIDEPIDENATLMHLSGFMDASSYWDVSIGDIWKWDLVKEAKAIKEVMYAISIISGLERNQLIRDVRILKASLQKKDSDSFSPFHDRLVHVDTQPNWELVKKLPISLDNLEIALLHQSDWVVILATNLLEQKATKEEVLPILGRLLEKGTDTTLVAAAYLMSHLNPNDALVMIRKRLLGAMSKGCEALFDKLGELDNVLDGEEFLQCIRNGLLCMIPKVAIAASELAAKAASLGVANISTLIFEAYQHWQGHEEPYPVSGGVIPDSPRSLLAKAMLLLNTVDDKELISMAKDVRPDVREVSKEALLDRLKQNESFRDLFLHAIDSRELDINLLSDALENKTSFSVLQCASIRGMLQHNDAIVRYTAIPILAEPYSTVDEIEQHALLMMQDSEAEIREVARELSKQNLEHQDKEERES